jgi:hypothetical protein
MSLLHVLDHISPPKPAINTDAVTAGLRALEWRRMIFL